MPMHVTKLPVTCDAALYPQACAHYHSAGVGGYHKIATSVTCASHFKGTDHRKGDWPAVNKWKLEHRKPWRQWIDPSQFWSRDITNKGTGAVQTRWYPSCDVDEWPPAGLLPLEAKHDGNNYP